MPLANTSVTIPHVKIILDDPKGTSRNMFAPIYEVPLLERLWIHTGVRIRVSEIDGTGPGGRPWPDDIVQREATFAEEEERLKFKYEKNPSTKEPVYEAVYGFGRFSEAFDRAVSGEWSPRGQPKRVEAQEPRGTHPAMQVTEPYAEEDESPPPEEEAAPEAPADEAQEEAPTPAPAWAALTAVKGLGEELAQALYEDGIRSVEDVANLPIDELIAYPGVGAKSGPAIQEHAVALTLAEMEA